MAKILYFGKYRMTKPTVFCLKMLYGDFITLRFPELKSVEDVSNIIADSKTRFSILAIDSYISLELLKSVFTCYNGNFPIILCRNNGWELVTEKTLTDLAKKL